VSKTTVEAIERQLAELQKQLYEKADDERLSALAAKVMNGGGGGGGDGDSGGGGMGGGDPSGFDSFQWEDFKRQGKRHDREIVDLSSRASNTEATVNELVEAKETIENRMGQGFRGLKTEFQALKNTVNSKADFNEEAPLPSALVVDLPKMEMVPAEGATLGDGEVATDPEPNPNPLPKH